MMIILDMASGERETVARQAPGMGGTASLAAGEALPMALPRLAEHGVEEGNARQAARTAAAKAMARQRWLQAD